MVGLASLQDSRSGRIVAVVSRVIHADGKRTQIPMPLVVFLSMTKQAKTHVGCPLQSA